MKKYVSNYLKYFGYKLQSDINCTVCRLPAVDLHHIQYKSQGGGDEVNNIVSLCRTCHEKAHKGVLTREYLQDLQDNKIAKYKY